MTKQELFNLYEALHSVGDLSGVKFAYNVAKNIDLLRPEVEALNKAKEPSKEFMEYEQERVELAKKYAKKIGGKPVVVDNEYQFEPEDLEKFHKEWAKLKKKHDKAIKAREEQAESFNSLLDEEVSDPPKLWKVSVDHVPEGITAQQMASILPIIDDPEDKQDK